MKRTMICFAILAVTFAVLLCPSFAFAQSTGIAVSCKSALLMSEHGDVVFGHNSHDKLPIASMTKLMTLLCVYEEIECGKLSLEDKVTVSDNAADMGGSQVFLDANSVHSVENLLKSIIVCSANDSCVALAEHLCGSVEGFVRRMNDKAQELGLTSTHFANCTGLPAVDGYSSAFDVAQMMRQLLRQEHYFTCSSIWMEDYVHPSGRVTGMTNTNKLSRFFKGCDGGKTGYTSEAQHCLCATAKRNETRFIAVVIGACDSKTRFAETSSLLNYGFANFETKVYLDKATKLDKLAVSESKQGAVEIGVNEPLTAFGEKGKVEFSLKLLPNENLKAPLPANESVGKAVLVNQNGETVKEVELFSREKAERKTIWDYVKEIIFD